VAEAATVNVHIDRGSFIEPYATTITVR
jgi:hypothetical protein